MIRDLGEEIVTIKGQKYQKTIIPYQDSSNKMKIFKNNKLINFPKLEEMEYHEEEKEYYKEILMLSKDIYRSYKVPHDF